MHISYEIKNFSSVFELQNCKLLCLNTASSSYRQPALLLPMKWLSNKHYDWVTVNIPTSVCLMFISSSSWASCLSTTSFCRSFFAFLSIGSRFASSSCEVYRRVYMPATKVEFTLSMLATKGVWPHLHAPSHTHRTGFTKSKPHNLCFIKFIKIEFH